MTLEDFKHLETDDILKLPYYHFIKVPFGRFFHKTKKLEVKPLTLGGYFSIDPYLIQIAKNDIKAMRLSAEENNYEEMPELFAKYGQPIISIIKIMTNATDEDIKVMTFWDIYVIFMAILSRMGTKSFKIAIITGSVVSRSQEQEIIACQQFLTQSIY